MRNAQIYDWERFSIEKLLNLGLDCIIMYE